LSAKIDDARIAESIGGVTIVEHRYGRNVRALCDAVAMALHPSLLSSSRIRANSRYVCSYARRGVPWIRAWPVSLASFSNQ